MLQLKDVGIQSLSLIISAKVYLKTSIGNIYVSFFMNVVFVKIYFHVSENLGGQMQKCCMFTTNVQMLK
jgi:hypothetical protein